MNALRSGEGRSVIPAALVGAGLLVGSVTVVEVLRVAVGRVPVTVPFAAGVVTSLPFAVLLSVGGYRLPRTTVAAERYRHVGLWTLAGLAFFCSFFGTIAAVMMTDVWVVVGTVRWGAAVGAGGGFLVGFVNARGLDRAVAAEREAVRAEEAEQRRRLLEYLNTLLRHEVLNTSNVIQGYAARLEEEEGTNRDYVRIIRNQAEELTRVTKDVRLLLSAPDDENDLEPTNVGRVVLEELRKLRDRSEAVETTVDLPKDVYVNADDLFGRLFSNLFANPPYTTTASRPTSPCRGPRPGTR